MRVCGRVYVFSERGDGFWGEKPDFWIGSLGRGMFFPLCFAY